MNDNMYLEPEELDLLLKGIDEKKLSRKKNLSIMERLDAKTGLETAGSRHKSRGLSKKAWLAIAACMALVVGMAFGGFAIAEESKEYNAALEYFKVNKISTEGMSRAEIKAVYRSVTTESLSYDDPNEVVAGAETDSVKGWEILTEDVPSTADFNSVYNAELQRLSADDELSFGISNSGAGAVWKESNGKRIWKYESSDLYACCEGVSIDGGTAVYAQRMIESDEGTVVLPTMFKLDDEGQLVWMTNWADDQTYHDMIVYDSDALVSEPDGGVTAFSIKRDYERQQFAICVTRFDPNGNIIFDVENSVGNYWVSSACKCEGGYLARVLLPSKTVDGERYQESSVVRFDEGGNITGEYSFKFEGLEVSIKDMKLLGERLYVSAAVTDIAKLNELINAGTEPNAEEIYTAMLFICDPDNGALREFYQVKGAEGAAFLEGSELVWKVNRIASLEFVSGRVYKIRGTAEVWSYSFNENCELIESVSTGDLVAILK